MKRPRRKLLRLAAGAAVLPVFSRGASAVDYPIRPVRLIVGFAPGQAIDITTRMIGQWLSERLGQQFIVENRPGAGGNIGTEAVVRAPPDGYMLLAIGSNNMINATLYEKLNFNFIRDIAPVASVAGAPKDTPGEIIDKLNREINAALADPKMNARLADLGGLVLPLSPAEYGRRIAEETEKWGKVIKFAGARAD
jgi:tripartite-type tricarboxylate transporter receptor subunit TctC